ncbi:MAG: LytR/AlgR family response regulator transcription factor [Bacteroidota bacterium]
MIIVDDEAKARELLQSLISETPGFQVLALCDGVDSAWESILEKLPDAIFLDIQMPVKDGFVLVEMLQDLDKIPEIIFTTAHEKFSIQATKAAAFDYLLKPVKKDELRSTLCRHRVRLKENQQMNQIKILLQNITSQEKIRLNDRHGFHLIDPKQVVFVMAEGSYCRFVISDGRDITATINIGKVLELLVKGYFLKVSRSCIVNLDYLVRVDRKNLKCELKANTSYQCPVSRSHFSSLEAAFHKR